MSGELIGLIGDLVMRTPGITIRFESNAGFRPVRRELHRLAVTVDNQEVPLLS